MVEPPGSGFTGVVWEARPTDQLARELTTGPGSVPLAEAAAAWGRLAANFGAAVLDYDRIVTDIRAHWQSDNSDAVLERIARMRDWLLDAATAAGRNAARAGEQAAAYEIARLAMPHVAEIAALEQAMHTVQALGAALGAPLVGAAADISADQDVAKADAARVMRTYEAATEPLAAPWQQAPPPVLSTGEALAGEQATTAATTTTASTVSPPTMPVMPTFASMPVPLSGTRVQTVARVLPSAQLTAVPAAATQAGTPVGQAIPAAAAPAAGASDDERTARAGAAVPTGEFAVDSGFAAAPAVLGGAETARVPVAGES